MSGFFTTFEASPQLSGSEQPLALEFAFDDGGRERVEIGSVRFAAPAAPRRDVPVATLTICLATWNPESAALARQIDTLIAQDFTDWVCIVSDDCSAKPVYTRIREICARDPRFHVFRNERNLGFYRNFEAAMKRVPEGSAFVALCDQDDIWYPNKLSACLAAFKPETQLVYCDMRIVRESGEVVATSYWTRRRNQYRDLDVLIIANTVTGAASVFRASLLTKMLPFPERIGDAFHDHWIACCALAGGGIEYVNRPLYDYIQHDGNVIGHATFDALPTLAARVKQLFEGVLAPGKIKRRIAAARAMLLYVFAMEYRRLHLIAESLRLRFATTPGLATSLSPFLDANAWGFALGLRHFSSRFSRSTTGNAELRIAAALFMRHASRWYVRRRARLMIGRIRARLVAMQAAGQASGGKRMELSFLTEKIAPLKLAFDPAAVRRVNLLLPEINFDNFFGGYMGKFNLARKLAEAGFQVRMVIVDWCDVRPEKWRAMVNRYEGLAGFFSYVEVAYCFDREQPLSVNPQDAFIASTWWTAHIASDAMQQLARNAGEAEPRPFTYLIQEYEPFTFAMGTLYALADQSYTFPHRALFSTGLLEQYFRLHHLGVFAKTGDADASSMPFENAILRFDVDAAAIARRTRRKLLFYARPEEHAARNMFQIGMLALEQAIAGGVFANEPWEFHGIGTSHGDIEFAAGGVLKMLGKVSLDEYQALLPQYDVGLSLMYTPHPSLVPLEMAAAGMLCVTNTCLNKTADRLADISGNIVAAAPSVDGVAAALAEAVGRAGDLDARVAGSRVNWASSWDAAFNEDIMGRLGAWLQPYGPGPGRAEEFFFESRGHCAVCGGPGHFVARDAWLRDNFKCTVCGSIPRERALLTVLEQNFPGWRNLVVHESSPGLPSSKKLAREGKGYVCTHFFPDVAPGKYKFGIRSENLEAQTFADASFDLVITQEVMEHVLDPPAAFREIARTLRPGGAHVFTTPVYKDLANTEVRARRHGGNGEIEYLAEAEYHGNPIDTKGALVTMHYGADIAALIFDWSGLQTRIFELRDPSLGLDGEFLEVMVSSKPD